MSTPVPALAVAGLLLNAAVWGLSWWPFRHLQALGVHPLWTTVFMYALASAGMLAWRPGGSVALWRHPALWVIALASGGTNAAFNWAVAIGEVVRVVLLFYLAPVWAVLLARGLLGERLGLVVWLRVGLAVGGAGLVLAGPGGSSTGAVPASGALADGLALVGGMLFALINVMLRREAARDSRERALAMFVGGAVVPAVMCLGLWLGGFGPATVFAPPAWSLQWVLPGLALAVVFFAGNLALQYGAARLPAQLTAVIMPMEVVFAAASAVAWGGEVLHWPLLAGGALILAASLSSVWSPAVAADEPPRAA